MENAGTWTVCASYSLSHPKSCPPSKFASPRERPSIAEPAGISTMPGATGRTFSSGRRGFRTLLSCGNWVDAEGKELIKFRMETGSPENSLPEEVPVERLQMPDVKDDAMPLGDGTLVKKFGPNQIKQTVALRPRLIETSKQFVLDCGPVLRSEHLQPSS